MEDETKEALHDLLDRLESLHDRVVHLERAVRTLENDSDEHFREIERLKTDIRALEHYK